MFKEITHAQIRIHIYRFNLVITELPTPKAKLVRALKLNTYVENREESDVCHRILEALPEPERISFDETILAIDAVQKMENFDLQPYIDELDAKEVAPKGFEVPLILQGEDFKLTAKWDSFRAYDRGADLQSHDPCYTAIASKTPASARRLYKAAVKDPKFLAEVSFRDLRDFLRSKRYAAEYQFSQWT